MSHREEAIGALFAVLGQLSLGASVATVKRNAATYAHTAGTKVFTFTASYAAGDATGALTEAGVFNAATAGIMFDRVVFPVVNKGVDDSLTAVFTFTMS